MKMEVSKSNATQGSPRGVRCALVTAAAVLASLGVLTVPVEAQNPYSSYIPTAVPTATTTLYTASGTISPGRIAVDKAGDAFYIAHTSGAASTLYELPVSSSTGIPGAPRRTDQRPGCHKFQQRLCRCGG